MSDDYAGTPRVFIARHGETAWSKLGLYTGSSSISLLPEGENQVSTIAKAFVGAGKLLDPSSLARAFVSPLNRAKQTFGLLLPRDALSEERISYTKDLMEWDYGDYEGKTRDEVLKMRADTGLPAYPEWSVWRDGCEGGEYVLAFARSLCCGYWLSLTLFSTHRSKDQITERLDRIIKEIRDIQCPLMNGGEPADVLLVAHGLILRCLAKRWVGYEIDANVRMQLRPGALAVLSYDAKDINKPCLDLGLALPPA
ncbi:phosphoglycerate mutase [Colletotrichum chrysophilum]|uniref:Phosphoglycerate mutase n=1 Tax=Colletotrichum chrysophilum TaxID=1836956 RepID=A0AAD9A151_9PEZI|nr:phosphoglycerate mutase [Colletotrichum chrysophilum]